MSGEEEEEEQYFTIDDLLADDDGQQVQAGGLIKSVREAAVQTTDAWSNHLKQAKAARTNRRRPGADEYRSATARKTAAETEASLRSEIVAAQARAERAEESSRTLRDELSARLRAVASEAGRQRARAKRAERMLAASRSGVPAGAAAVEPEPEPEPEPEMEPETRGPALDSQSKSLREACLVSAGRLQQVCSEVVEAAARWPTRSTDYGNDAAGAGAATPAPSGWKAIKLGQHAAAVATSATAALGAANSAHAHYEGALKESRRREAEHLARATAAEAEIKLQNAELESLRDHATMQQSSREREATTTSADDAGGAGAHGALLGLQAEVAMLSDALQGKVAENGELQEQAAELRASKAELSAEIAELTPGGGSGSGGQQTRAAREAAAAAAEQKAEQLSGELTKLQGTLREARDRVAALEAQLVKVQTEREKEREAAKKQEEQRQKEKAAAAQKLTTQEEQTNAVATTASEAKATRLQELNAVLQEQLASRKKALEEAGAENEMLKTTIQMQEQEKWKNAAAAAGKSTGGGGGGGGGGKLTL
jgi:hypothetical protein